jgi:hypothetical protein
VSGFVERVIEDWLTKASERSYQLPFAAYLSKQGHTIQYLSPHSALEHGKDIVSTESRTVHAYQLKAGNVDMATWRSIQEEVREAATVPIDIPGLPRRLPHRAYLVLSGHLSDPVRNQINLINDDHAARAFAPIEVIELRQLVSGFANLFDTFCPADIRPIHELVGLYLRDGRGPQDKVTLHSTFHEIAGNPKPGRAVGRAAANLVVAAEFASAPFRQAQNHISVIDSWVLAAAMILKLAKQSQIESRYWSQSLALCKEAIDRSAQDLLTEVLSRQDFIEGAPFFDSTFIGHRRTMVLGYAAAVLNAQSISGADVRLTCQKLIEVTKRELPFEVWGEAAWNYQLNLALALRHVPEGLRIGEQVVSAWLRHVCPRRGPWPKDPYWSVEASHSLEQLRIEETHEGYERAKASYSAGPAMSFLARRMLRQTLAILWSSVSRYQLARVVPREAWMEFEWQIDDGIVEMERLPLTGSWSSLRKRAFTERSSLFNKDEIWLLPYFLCTYPHRITSKLAGELDYRTSPEPFREEWQT